MSNHFGVFLMGVIVIVILMLINITAVACYRELKRSRPAAAGGMAVPVVSKTSFTPGPRWLL